MLFLISLNENSIFLQKKNPFSSIFKISRTPLAVQWLRHRVSNASATGSISTVEELRSHMPGTPTPSKEKKKSPLKNKTSSHYLPCNIPLDQSLFLDFHYNFWLVLLPSKLASVCSKHNKDSNCCLWGRLCHFFSPQSPPATSHLALSGWWTRRSCMISSLVNIVDLVS